MNRSDMYLSDMRRSAEPRLDIVDFEALFREVLLILGFDVIFGERRGVQVVRQIFEPEAVVGKFDQRKLEQREVVGLQNYRAVRL